MTQIERAGAITKIDYSPTNLTTAIELPNGNRLDFFYNDARQLIGIENGAGERVDYTRNAMNGILSTRIPDSSGTIQYSMTLARDEINRVVSATGVNWTKSYEYDEMNNLTDITDGRNNDWKQNFDNLDRLTEEIDPLGGTTNLDLDNQMDSRNPLTKVTDKRGVETNYVRNGFGEVIREVSLEAGTTEYVRDDAGRIIQMTDARGIVSDYAYDGMDRLLSVTFPNAVSTIDDITYGYDVGEFGVGELTSITEGFGITTYEYDDLAHMIRMTRTINGVEYECEYEYDDAGEVTAMIYPSSRRIEYARDGAARETRITMVAPDGTSTILADNISYKPFGPIDAIEMGDGNDLSINYDANYRATRLTRGGAPGQLMDLGFTYDEESDITGLRDFLRPERSQVLGYDALSRLTSADGGYGSIDYSYNAGDDRTSRDWTKPDGVLTAETYSYDALTARLTSVSPSDTAGNLTPIREFDYHASGQVSGDLRGANAYLYGLNDRGRLTTITRNGEDVATYIHDESEQRIAKTVDGVTIHYHYDLDGRLVSETDGATGETLRDYVWLGLMPIAVIDPGEDAPDTACEEEIAALMAQIADTAAVIDSNAERIAQFFERIAENEETIARNDVSIARFSGLITDREARVAANTARADQQREFILDKQARMAENSARLADLNAAIAADEARIAANTAEIESVTALIAEAEAELATLDPVEDAGRIAFLTQRNSARQARVDLLLGRNVNLQNDIADRTDNLDLYLDRNAELSAEITAHEAVITKMEDRNAGLEAARAGFIESRTGFEERNAGLVDQNLRFEALVDVYMARNISRSEELVQLEAELAEAKEACNTSAGDGLYYLHADHLGRPQFATDPSGAVVWDMGASVTPFGDIVNLAGAFAQRLMFPGQYADVETGDAANGDTTSEGGVTLSHNWHRTYDPTLGRYLQSDPIGLAGGLNRFAYAGGNPMSWVDPDGLATIAHPNGGYIYIGGPEIPSILGRAGVGSLALLGGYYIGYYGGAYYYHRKHLSMQNEQDCSNDNNSEEDCRRIKNECIQGCSDFVLGKPRKRRVGNDGHDFNRCVRQCMDRNGC